MALRSADFSPVRCSQVEQLESIAAKLRAMPPAEKKPKEHTKQEAIKILAREIKAMQARGYSLEAISATLRGEGIAITTPTLKSYLQRTKPVKKTKKPKPEAPAKATSKPTIKKRKETPVAPKGKFIPTPDSEEI